MHMLNRITVAGAIGAVLIVPLLLYAQTREPSYRYNRITAEYTVQKNGTVDVAEFFTMYYEGTFRSAWRVVPNATSTTASTTATNIRVYDGSTGKELVRTDARLESDNSEHWGKYALYDQPGGTAVEWVYDTNDRVRTWILRYTLHNAVTVDKEGRADFSHDIFSGFVAPVDTVEAEVILPEGVSNAGARISTTEEHGSYIDRPNDHSFRFRVSDIGIGETVAVQIGWQRPEDPFVSTARDTLESALLPIKDYLVGALLGCLIFAGIMRVWRRRKRQSTP